MITRNACQLIFDHLPGSYLILEPDAPYFTILNMNQAYAETVMQGKKITGKGILDTFTEYPNLFGEGCIKKLEASLVQVLKTKMPHQMSFQKYNLQAGPDTKEGRFWLPVNTPVLDNDQTVLYIIHSIQDVTDSILLKEVENKAQKESELLHQEQLLILESIADGFISTDRNWIVKYWNRQAERIFNISRSDIVGQYLWDVIKESQAKRLYEFFSDAMQNNKPVSFEKYYALQDTWLQINAYPSEQGLTAFLVDITDNKKAQEEIYNNERRFRALIDSIADGLAIISSKGIIMDISHSGKKILGYGFQDLVENKKYKKLIHPDDLPKVVQAFESVIKDSSNNQLFISKLTPSVLQNTFKNPAFEKTVEFRFKMKDGQIKWLEGTFHNLVHEPTIRAVVLNFCDISSRREQEEQLVSSEEKYRYLFNNSPAVITIWTLDDLCIQEVNQTAINLYDYTRDEFLCMSILDMMPVEEHERMIHLVIELRKGINVKTGIWQRITKNGMLIYMDFSFHIMEYAGRQAVLALGINVTEKITLQKKLEDERRRKQQEITEAVLTTQENERAELGKELHDNINQILTTTRLYIEHALSKKEKQEVLLQYSQEYISKAIFEIRQLSRTLMPPSLGEVSLKHELEEIFSNLNALKDYNFEFDFLLKNEEIICPALKLAIFRIIQEQLNNIIKHADATRVAVRILQIDHKIKLYIKDDGKGFDLKKGPRGMGLRNITSRANFLGGQVKINSKVGKGTELLVIFPI